MTARRIAGSRASARLLAITVLALGAAPRHTRAQARSPLVVGVEGLQVDPRVAARLADSARALRAERAAHPRDERVALSLAGVELRRGGTAAAAALLDTLVGAPRPSAAAVRAAASLRLYSGHADSAAALLARASSRLPDDAALWLLLGEARRATKDPRGAADAYARATLLLSPPDSAEHPLVDAYVAAGDTAAAIRVLDAASGAKRARSSRRWAAHRAAEIGAFAVADRAYAALVADGDHDASTLTGAMDAALAVHDTVRALTLARTAMRDAGTGPEPLLVLLHAGHIAPDSADALLDAAAERAVAAHQRNSAAALALARSSPDTHADASDLQRGERLVRWTLDTLAFQTDRGREALDALRRAHPRDDLLRSYAARLALRQGRTDDAVELFDVAVQRAPDDVDAQVGFAQALAAAGRTSAGDEAAARALELAPERDDVYRLRLTLAERESRLPELLGQLRRLRIRIPTSRPLGEHEVEVLQRLGRLAEAARVARSLPGERPS